MSHAAGVTRVELPAPVSPSSLYAGTIANKRPAWQAVLLMEARLPAASWLTLAFIAASLLPIAPHRTNATLNAIYNKYFLKHFK